MKRLHFVINISICIAQNLLLIQNQSANAGKKKNILGGCISQFEALSKIMSHLCLVLTYILKSLAKFGTG